LDVSVCCETLQALVLNEEIRDRLNELKMEGLKKWCDEMSQRILGQLITEIEISSCSKPGSKTKQWENGVPRYASPYIDKICLQFVQTVLWIATVPQTFDWKNTLFLLEKEFRKACSTQMNRQLQSLLCDSTKSFTESSVVQLWFDVLFAKLILGTNVTDWNQTLTQIHNRMDMVTLSSIQSQLENEVRYAVHRSNLLYGTSHIFSGLAFESTNSNDNKPSPLYQPKDMPRLQMLPIATYDIGTGKRERNSNLSGLGELEIHNERTNLTQRLSSMNSPTPTHFISHALTRANTLFQNLNFGTMFK